MKCERRMNPKCQTRPGFDTFSAKSADLTGSKMRRITRAASCARASGPTMVPVASPGQCTCWRAFPGVLSASGTCWRRHGRGGPLRGWPQIAAQSAGEPECLPPSDSLGLRTMPLALALSDKQIAELQTIARPIPPALRGQFLQRFAGLLRGSRPLSLVSSRWDYQCAAPSRRK